MKWKFPFQIWQKTVMSLEGIWNEEIIYFVYATEIKLLIIPYTTYVYHSIP
jgi:hypothetical protein